MNRERLKILRDHLASLPDEAVDMCEPWAGCGTACCIGGWSNRLFRDLSDVPTLEDAVEDLSLNDDQKWELFYARSSGGPLSELSRTDAVAALDSMLSNPDDNALAVWPAA